MADMKIVLTEDIDNVGEMGEVVKVAGGYARNYLIPRGLAVAATKGNVRHAEQWRQQREARAQKEVNEAKQLKQRLETVPLRIPAQAGPDGQLFGSITTAHLAEAISAVLDTSIDRQSIELDEPIRHLGFHEVSINLHPDVTANVTVEATEH